MSKRSKSRSGIGSVISFILALLAAIAIILFVSSRLPAGFSFTDIVTYIRQDTPSSDELAYQGDNETDIEIITPAENDGSPYDESFPVNNVDDTAGSSQEDGIPYNTADGDNTDVPEEENTSSDDTLSDSLSDAAKNADENEMPGDIEPSGETDTDISVTEGRHPAAEYAAVQTITITAAGDCTLGGDTTNGSYKRFKSYFEDNGAPYFLENVKDIFENDDLTIVNLEGTFTESTKRKSKEFSFKGDYKFSRILTEGSVELVSIDNNHSQDYYAQGVADTKKTLDYIGVGYAGLDIKYTTEIKGVKIGFLSYRIWDVTADKLKTEVSEMKKDCDLVIVAIHWGEERVTKAGNDQIKMGHAAIDAGADLVLGHHPHVIGSIELYKGKYIVYSLGNFCFGGNQNPADKDTFIFQATYTMSEDGITDTDIKVIPCTVSSVSTTNDYKPTPVEFAKGGLEILRRIADASKQFDSVPDWNALAAKLNVPKD